MAVTRERKLEIAARSYDLLAEQVRRARRTTSSLIRWSSRAPRAISSTWASAVETIEGIRLIKQALPECKTILGISNVSFGLPPAGREVLNSVFLYHCDPGRPRYGHRQRGEARALRQHSRTRSASSPRELLF